MFPSFCKRFQLLLFSTRRIRNLVQSKPQLGLVPYKDNDASQPLLVRLLSTSSSSSLDLDEKEAFTVSYLLNTCGLSLETAKSVSKKVHFKTPEKPDSVFKLLRKYGFTNTHITKLLRQCPKVLVANSEKTILPKFKFLDSIGVSGDHLVNFVCLNPRFLIDRSLENRILPLYTFLKNLLCDDKKVAKVFRGLRWLISADVQKNLAPNIAVFRQLGVPESSIFSTLTIYTSVMFQDRDKFEKLVKDLIREGYDPKKVLFIEAMHVFSSMTKSTQEHKIEVYKGCGWSETDIELALKICPLFLIVSEKKIMDTMDFLLNKMGYQSDDIVRCPSILRYNLEKKTIPRCLVMKVLLFKGLLKKELRLATFLTLSEKRFLERFVTKYQEHIPPQLLNIYQGKTSLLKLGVSYEEICGFKTL